MEYACHVICTDWDIFLLRMRQPSVAKPDRQSQSGQPSVARHPKSTQETRVYDGQFGRNRRSQFGQPNLADLPSALKRKRTCCSSSPVSLCDAVSMIRWALHRGRRCVLRAHHGGDAAKKTCPQSYSPSFADSNAML